MAGLDDADPREEGAALAASTDDTRAVDPVHTTGSAASTDPTAIQDPVDLSTETPEQRLARFERDAVPYLGPLLRRAKYLIKGDTAAAEDLVQITYEKAYKYYSSFKPGTNFGGWITTILENSAKNFYRSESRRPKGVSVDSINLETQSDYAQALFGDAPAAEESALDRVSDAEIREVLDSLSADFRRVVVLHDVEGYPYKDIATMLQIPEGTVMSRLSRARGKLKAGLQQIAIERGYAPQPSSASGDSADSASQAGGAS